MIDWLMEKAFSLLALTLIVTILFVYVLAALLIITAIIGIIYGGILGAADIAQLVRGVLW